MAYTARFTLRADAIAMNGAVLGFSVAIAVGAAFALAWVPRLRIGVDGRALGTGGATSRSTTSSAQRTGQRILIVGQFAFSFVLLVGAGLLLRSFVGLQRVDPGFHIDRILTLRAPNYTRRGAEQNRALFDEVTERLRAYPGVVSVATALSVPLENLPIYTWQFRTDGTQDQDADRRAPISFNSVSASYFDTLAISIVRGRGLTAADRAGSERVAVVNESLAAYVFGGHEPVGRKLQWSFDGRRWDSWRTIVGVARDTRERGLHAGIVPMVYESSTQGITGPGLLIRTAGDPGGAGREAARIIHEIDPKRPVVNVGALEISLAERVAPWRLNALLVGAFALLALLIAAVGIASLLAFSVSQRTRELGIRITLGADRLRILRTVLGEALLLATAGVAIGAASAFALTRTLSRLLFGVGPDDPMTYGGAVALVVAVTLGAVLVPSLRATRVNPVVALTAD